MAQREKPALFEGNYKEALLRDEAINGLQSADEKNRQRQALDKWAWNNLDFREYNVWKLREHNAYANDGPAIEAIKLMGERITNTGQLLGTKFRPVVAGKVGKWHVHINSLNSISIWQGEDKASAEVSSHYVPGNIRFAGPKDLRFVRRVYAFRNKIMEYERSPLWKRALNRIMGK